VSRLHRLATPADDEQQRTAVETAAEVGDRVDRGLVGAVDVVEEDDPRSATRAGRADDGAHGLQQPHAGPGAVERQRGRRVGPQRGELG